MFVTRVFHIAMFLLIIFGSALLGHAEKWDDADRRIIRLKPQEIRELPKNVQIELKKMNCQIPQTNYYGTKSHGFTKGMFAKEGQIDWAVLCSVGGKTSIVFVWGGKYTCPNTLNGYSDSSLGWTESGSTVNIWVASRMISVSPKDTFKDVLIDGQRQVTHDALHDSLDDDKPYYTWYCENGGWIQLPDDTYWD